MHKRLAILLLLVAATAQAKSSLTIPPITFAHRTLANGLEVYAIRDTSTPTVAIHVWYHVGSKNDPDHRSGFAHLFEHIMFKSTKNMPSEMMDRLTEDVGGFNNATTQEDATIYYEVVPSNYLETLLWAEGERMGSLTIDEKNFESERNVVKEEYRYRVLAPPYGRFYNSIDRDSFAVHPYRRPGIGSIEDLDASTVTDVQAFHSTFYRPDNAVLIVAGDFEPMDLDSWINKYLGVIPRPSATIPRVSTKEPARKAPKRVAEHGPNVPLPAVAITWLAPPESSADATALDVAAAILAQGESSRQYQSLVYRKKIAQDTQADADLREDLGIFGVLATMATGHTAAEGEKALMTEVRALAQKPVPATELQKAKNLLLADAVRTRETNTGKAFSLGRAIIVDHDPDEVNRGLQRLQAVSAADVQRVMKKYVTNAKPVVITYTAEGGAK